MTVTNTDTIDPQGLAVAIEGALDPTSGMTTSLVDDPSTVTSQPDVQAWEFSVGKEQVVMATASPDVVTSEGGLLETITTAFGGAPNPADVNQLPPAEGTVVVVANQDGPIATLRISTPTKPASSAAPNNSDGGDALLSLGMLHRVPLEVTAELGRTRMPVAQVLQLRVGSTIQLDREVGAAADVIVNGAAIAHGEVVVVNEKYGIKITEIIGRASDGSK